MERDSLYDGRVRLVAKRGRSPHRELCTRNGACRIVGRLADTHSSPRGTVAARKIHKGNPASAASERTMDAFNG